MLHKNMFLKKHSVFVSWLVSYVSILLIPVAISSVVYFLSAKVIEDEINRANVAMLKQVQQVIDAQMEGVKNLSMNIALNQRVAGLLYRKQPLPDFCHYNITEIIKDLKAYNTVSEENRELIEYNALNGCINDFYIYFSNSGIVINPMGVYEPEVLFNEFYDKKLLSFEQWDDLMRKRRVNDLEFLGRIDPYGNEYTVIEYSNSLPLGDHGQAAATIVVSIKETGLKRIMEDMKWVNEQNTFILDKNDNSFASIADAGQFKSIKYTDLSESRGMFYKKIAGEQFTVSYITSKTRDWKYVSVIPERIFMEKAQNIKLLIGLSLLLCLLFGSIMALFFSKKNYKPVKDIVQTLQKRTKLTPKKSNNEIDFIHQAVSSTLDEKEKINEKFKQQSIELKSTFIMKLLKGRIDNTLVIQDVLSSFDIRFETSEFAVMLLYIEDFSKFFEDGNDKHIEEKLKFVRFIICNVSEELIGRSSIGVTTEVDEMMACLINFKSTNHSENMEEMMRMANEINNFLRDRFGIYLTVCISEIHHTLESIPEAYQETLEAMSYKMIIDREIISYSEIIGMKNSHQSYEYSLEHENQLINNIKAGDFKNAKEILDKIFDNNFHSRSLSIQMAKCLIFDIISTIVKAINNINISSDNTFFSKLNMIDKLVSCKTIMEMKQEITKILKETCEHIDCNKKSHNITLSDNVIRFVESNYFNLNLSISMIADELNSNPVYLSRLFKEQTGEGLLDFINRVRINHAKRILKKQEISVGDTAIKVGYNNSAALIRAFRKYEGITPGQYKESC